MCVCGCWLVGIFPLVFFFFFLGGGGGGGGGEGAGGWKILTIKLWFLGDVV